MSNGYRLCGSSGSLKKEAQIRLHHGGVDGLNNQSQIWPGIPFA